MKSYPNIWFTRVQKVPCGPGTFQQGALLGKGGFGMVHSIRLVDPRYKDLRIALKVCEFCHRISDFHFFQLAKI